jgi:TolB-like protein/AraC-like DNA-binding protein
MEDQSSMSDQFLTLINRIIEENLDNEHFSVDDLASKAGLSRSMLHRKLIKLIGKSASDLITEKRLLRAKELLENDVATASEIAYRVGFSSPSYFNKVFKQHFNISPGDLKKKAANSYYQKEEEPSPEPAKSGRSKISFFRVTALLILLAIIVAGGIIYYISSQKKPTEKSIAILPFYNLSINEEDQFFADGIMEDLLYRLSATSELKVISRTSSEVFRNKGSRTVPEIAELLGVSYILEGSVQRQANNVRITIQLIDAAHDNHILSRQYDRNLNEVFRIQTELAQEIASELSLALTDEQKKILKKNHTNNLKAFDYVQLGRYHLNKRMCADNSASITYFRRAISEDPKYALAYAEMADAYYIAGWYDYISRKTGRDSAEYLALKALKLDPDIGQAHTVLAGIYYEYDWNYIQAEKEFKQALLKSPNHATTYQYYSEMMTSMGNLLKARELVNRAVQLDPYSYIIRFASFFLYVKEKKYGEALAESQICQGLAENNAGPISTNFILFVKTDNDLAALDCFKKLGEMNGEWTPELSDSIFLADGIRGLLSLRIMLDHWPIRINKADYYAMLGDKDKALSLLEQALEEGYLVPFNTTDPEFEDLHNEPRFIAIRKKMGLPPLK